VPPFQDLSPRQKGNEIVRWLLLVPVAWFASTVVRPALGIMLRTLLDGSGSSNLHYWLHTGLYFSLPMVALVLIGAWIAPRKPLLVAALLTLVFGALSLLKHVVGQFLGGNAVGFINYMHFTLEMAGLLAGVVCVHRLLAARHHA
jgi:hypothetical protein